MFYTSCGLEFWIVNFEILSDFEIRISDFYSLRLGATSAEH
jgi:hypothetical protein